MPFTDQKSCTAKNASPERLTEIIRHNLGALENIIEYNAEKGIRLYRISSDLIPFGSSPVNTLDWQQMFAEDLGRIGRKIAAAGIRVSMHPGQYTVLNSPDEDVVTRAVEDLEYHCRVLDALGTGRDCKIILHVGGIYTDKAVALRRFEENVQKLNEPIRRRLVIENDERCYTAAEVLALGEKLGIPVVFDTLHHQINPSGEGTEADWVAACKPTWKAEDGPQKIHYAQQAAGKKPGSHSDTIAAGEFLAFCEALGCPDLDIMLETKDKNLSAVKCLNCTNPGLRLKTLEGEWARYKYTVMEHSHQDYLAVRMLFANKSELTPAAFYGLVESALRKPLETSTAVNAAQHVWGYFKDQATPKQKADFLEKLSAYSQSKLSLAALKNTLHRLAVDYDCGFLIHSYYFTL